MELGTRGQRTQRGYDHDLASTLGVVYDPTWGFPKIGGTLLGVPIIRIIVFWGLHWDPSF